MKKKIKFGTVLVCVCAMLIATACGSANAGDASGSSDAENAGVVDDGTVAGALAVAFMENAKEGVSPMELAETLQADPIFDEIAMGSMEVSEGLLNGFEGEIKGFDRGAMFAPMIGSIPFVAYVFRATDADALTESLTASYQLNWNICTVADDMRMERSGDLVFFVMAPTSFDQ